MKQTSSILCGIVNITRATLLHERPSFARTSFAHAKGFMFQKPGNRAIVFVFAREHHISLHMWFVFGAIDVVGLDDCGVIVALQPQFRPWSTWSSKVPVKTILEVPAGTIAASHSQLGDMIRIDGYVNK